LRSKWAGIEWGCRLEQSRWRDGEVGLRLKQAGRGCRGPGFRAGSGGTSGRDGAVGLRSEQVAGWRGWLAHG